ncbi:hypothetical protein [Streptomyces sp. NPDC001404]|uniref:hypothetical protein n=1 Tax=Streptomyces sp. NPDC001404 TaxID=3364571 RepID=UPI00369CD4F1
MSTPDYDMAPPATATTAPAPNAAQPQASGPAAVADPTQPERTRSSRSASRKADSRAGVLIPGGVLTGMIALCWMVHQYGLAAVVFAVLAAAAAATAAMALKAGRRGTRALGPGRRGGRANGGAGPGRRGPSNGGGGGARPSGRGGAGRLPVANRSGGSGPRRGTGPSGRGSTAPGGASRKPTGLGTVKKPSAGVGPKNSVTRTPGKGIGGTRPTAGPKPDKRSLLGGPRSGGGLPGGGKGRKNGGAPGGLLNRRNGGSGTPSSGSKGPNLKKNGTGTGPSGKSGKGPAGGKPGSPKTPKSPLGKKIAGGTGTQGGGKVLPFRRPKKAGPGGTPGTSPKGKNGKKGPAGKKKPGGKKGKVNLTKARAPRHRRYTWRQPHRKVASAVGRGYRAVVSPKIRHRLRQAGKPVRGLYRGTRKHGGKLLANAMRIGGRITLRVHSALGRVRYSTIGPNWLRPLSRLLYWATSPLAKLVTVSRSWSWLNAWVYRTATARPIPKPATAATVPVAGGGTPATPAPPSGGHTPVPSPATATAGGTPVDNSPVHHAYPLIYAADAIRMAAAAFAAAPADSMRGYEAVIENLGHLEMAMCHLLHDIAKVTEDDFKVNPHIPDGYREAGVRFLMLGQFVDQAHQLYRTLHAEQIENYENPSWQGRKWDISENWAHVMPQGAWTDPTVHAMPLLLASGAIRDAGIHIQHDPASTMFGYEMTIGHLAPLAEALYELMETVATVTEAEFAVHPAVTAMHRDAGLYFRDLGGAIQAVHLLYRVLHSEQINNLENPTPQAAKWDQSRNA